MTDRRVPGTDGDIARADYDSRVAGRTRYADQSVDVAAGARYFVPRCHWEEPVLYRREGPALSDQPTTKAEERRALVFLTILAAPIFAVAVVAGYGFLVWIMQLFTGPPGS